MASPQLFKTDDVVLLSPITSYYGSSYTDNNPSLVDGRVVNNGRISWSNGTNNSYNFNCDIISAKTFKDIYENIALSLAKILSEKKILYICNSQTGMINNLQWGNYYQITKIEDYIINTPTYREVPALNINIPKITLEYLKVGGSSGSEKVVVDVLTLLRTNFELFSDEDLRVELEAARIEAEKKLQERKVIIDMFTRSMIDTFGEEFIDVRDVNNTTEFITYFPDITIKNSQGRSHNIKNLYTKFVITENNIFDGALYGVRSTRTYSEVLGEYNHSHLRESKERKDWSSFCLGDATPIRMLITEFSTDKKNFTEENIDMFCYQLNSYVRWESLEGIPYRKMEGITTRRGVNSLNDTSKLEDIFNKYTTLYKDFTFNTENSNGFDAIKVVRNDEFEKRITGIAHEFAYKIGNNYYASNSSKSISSNYKRQIGDKVLTFKGIDIKYNLITGDDKEAKAQKVAHPKITEYVANRISEQFELFLSEEEYKDN
jgi:hypothetical protein